MNPENVGFQSYASAPRSGSRRRLFVIFALALLALVFLAVVITSLLPQNNASSKAAEFARLVRKGDSAGSYQLTDDEFRKNTTEENWKTTVDKISKVYTADPKVSEVKPSQNLAAPNEEISTVTLTVKGTDGDYLITEELVKVNEQYYVRYFDSRRQTTAN